VADRDAQLGAAQHGAARAAAALSYEHQRPADAEAGMYDEADDVSDLEDELAELQEETDNTLII
jgi:hypothetical protein